MDRKTFYQDEIVVEEGKFDRVKIGTDKKFFYPLKEGETNLVRYEYNLSEKAVAPIKKGDEIGEIKIFLDNNLLFSEKIFTMEDIKEKGILQKIFDVISQW